MATIYRNVKKITPDEDFRIEPIGFFVCASHQHSQKELAHWTVDVTVQNYACFSGSLRCNFRTAFTLSDRLHIYTRPVKNNKNVWMTKITQVEMIITSDGVCLLLRCSDALQWVYLRGYFNDFVHDSKMMIYANLSDMMINGGLSYLFWECRVIRVPPLSVTYYMKYLTKPHQTEDLW